ncbi:MAG: hypothetical protein DDT34_02551 [Firmicutes bacterium]|nr:hypothetical protein [Bacillota bacterium]
MAHPRIHIEEVGNALSPDKFTHYFLVSCGLDSGGWSIMIKHKGDPAWIVYPLAAHFIKRFNNLQVNVVGFGKVDLRIDDLPRFNLSQP